MLALAVAVNFEPMRLGLITVALSRPRPVAQLLAFLCGALTTSLGAGLLILLVIHHGLIKAVKFDGSVVQIVIGVVAILASAVLASNLKIPGFPRKPVPDNDISETGAPTGQPRVPAVVKRLAAHTKGLVRGSSPWFSAAMGVTIAVPSVDYIALLILIATSGSTLAVQTGALVTFVVVANTVVAVPIASFLLAPEKTRSAIMALRAWIAARSRRDFAVVLAVAGCVMIAVGVS